MKSKIGFYLAVICLLAACSPAILGGNEPYPPPYQPDPTQSQAYPPPQMNSTVSTSFVEGYPAPPNTPVPVTWEEAKEVILQGKVLEAVQQHSLTVILVLEDGTRLVTEEPEIDAFLAVIDECGTPCEDIGIVTE